MAGFLGRAVKQVLTNNLHMLIERLLVNGKRVSAGGWGEWRADGRRGYASAVVTGQLCHGSRARITAV